MVALPARADGSHRRLHRRAVYRNDSDWVGVTAANVPLVSILAGQNGSASFRVRLIAAE